MAIEYGALTASLFRDSWADGFGRPHLAYAAYCGKGFFGTDAESIDNICTLGTDCCELKGWRGESVLIEAFAAELRLNLEAHLNATHGSYQVEGKTYPWIYQEGDFAAVAVYHDPLGADSLCLLYYTVESGELLEDPKARASWQDPAQGFDLVEFVSGANDYGFLDQHKIMEGYFVKNSLAESLNYDALMMAASPGSLAHLRNLHQPEWAPYKAALARRAARAEKAALDAATPESKTRRSGPQAL